MTDNRRKNATCFRLSEDVRTFVFNLAEHLGLSMTSVLEMLIGKRAALEFGTRLAVGRGGR